MRVTTLASNTTVRYGGFSRTRSSRSGTSSSRAVANSKLLSDYSVESSRTKQSEWTGSSLVRPNTDTPEFKKATAIGSDSPELDQQWILASQVAVKLLVDREGWQRVSRLELITAGLDQFAPLANLQLFEGGVEQAIKVNADGSVEFFGRPLLTSSTDKRVYWLIAGRNAGRWLESGRPPAPPPAVIR